eukprot:Rhum_TRINITY_DN14317_c4_g1::Rhum_TRINITY_DN14317_c4_g1_i1::g.80319::m.80319/K08994/yneE; putative membrane protein
MNLAHVPPSALRQTLLSSGHNEGGSSGGRHRPRTQEEEMTRARRHVVEYRLWSAGVLGSLRFLFRVSGTVWTEIFGHLLFLVLLTVAFLMIHTFAHKFDVSLTGHQIVLVPMSFLLVFRCSNSYQRYWDGRSLLGSLVYSCRELVSKAYLYPSLGNAPDSSFDADADANADDADVARVSENIRRYTLATACLINTTVASHWERLDWERKARRRGGGAAAAAPFLLNLSTLRSRAQLTDEEFEDISSVQKTQPLLLLLWLRMEVAYAERRGYLTPLHALDMNQTLGELQQVWNGMLKITSTPLPYLWVHLSRVVLWSFLVTLIPPAVSVMTWVAIPFILVTSFLFLGLITVGNEMEDPFGTDINDFDLVAFEGIIKRDLDLMARTHATRRRRQQMDREERAKQGKEDNSDAAALFWRGGGVAAAAAAAGGGSFALGHTDAAAAAAAAASGGGAPAPLHQPQRRRSVTPTSVPSSASPGAGGGGGAGFGGPQEKERPLTAQCPGSFRASVDMGGSYVRCTELQRMRNTTAASAALDDCTHAVL